MNTFDVPRLQFFLDRKTLDAKLGQVQDQVFNLIRSLEGLGQVPSSPSRDFVLPESRFLEK